MAPTNATRYALGEIWWYENFDDVTALSTKIRACELNSAVKGAPFSTRLGCFVQRSKLRARRRLLLTVKNWAHATVNNYHSLRTALTGPSGKHGLDNSSYPRDAILARVPAVALSPCPCL